MTSSPTPDLKKDIPALEMERLRSAIAEGDAAVARGEVTVLTSDEDLDRFFADITI